MLQARSELNFDTPPVVNRGISLPAKAQHYVVASITVRLRVIDVVVLLSKIVATALNGSRYGSHIRNRWQDRPTSAKVLKLVQIQGHPPELPANCLHAFETAAVIPSTLSRLISAIIEYRTLRIG